MVVGVERDGVMAKVELACGDYRVVSLMSREAADDMGLEPGVAATAVVKSTSVMVEVGRSGHGAAATATVRPSLEASSLRGPQAGRERRGSRGRCIPSLLHIL